MSYSATFHTRHDSVFINNFSIRHYIVRATISVVKEIKKFDIDISRPMHRYRIPHAIDYVSSIYPPYREGFTRQLTF
jgi:hypothetical protein